MSQLHDLLSGGVRQGPAGHEDSAQLVDPAVTCSLQSDQEPRAGVKLGDKMAKFPQKNPWNKTKYPPVFRKMN